MTVIVRFVGFEVERRDETYKVSSWNQVASILVLSKTGADIGKREQRGNAARDAVVVTLTTLSKPSGRKTCLVLVEDGSKRYWCYTVPPVF